MIFDMAPLFSIEFDLPGTPCMEGVDQIIDVGKQASVYSRMIVLHTSFEPPGHTPAFKYQSDRIARRHQRHTKGALMLTHSSVCHTRLRK